jgi:polyphenol oxidase
VAGVGEDLARVKRTTRWPRGPDPARISLEAVTFRAEGQHFAADMDGATVLFTTRRGGVSEGPYESLNLGRLTEDDGASVDENRHRLARSVNRPWERFRWAKQVHGTHVDSSGHAKEADGQLVREADTPALVFVADCLPIALTGPAGVAMLHAGWRGLAGGIVANGVEQLGGATHAAIGPGIGKCCYEVGDEVREAFPPEAANGRHLDLRNAAHAALKHAGVEHIHDLDLCTSCHPDLFFSHRRDAGVTGRQAGLVWRRG